MSLSDPAFAALRREKRPEESDSDVVLRLIREARAKRKDVNAFLAWRPKWIWTEAEHDEFLRQMDEADRNRPAEG